MTKLFKQLWYGLDLTRKIVINFLFLLIIIWVLYAVFSSEKSYDIESGSALVLQPTGTIVEQLTYIDPIQELIQESSNNQKSPETLLYDLISSIENAKDDDRITTLVLSTSYLNNVGVTQLQDLSDAIDDFKTSGKPVIAFADNFTQKQYYLASKADTIYMNPQGSVLINGFAAIGTYFKSFIDLLEVNFHIFKVGKFKSAVEPYMRDSMSDEAKQANRAWLTDLWQEFMNDLASHREITADDLSAYINNYKELLIEHKGNGAELAIAKGLIDKLTTRIEFNELMIERVGENDYDSFKQVSHNQYLNAIKNPLSDMAPKKSTVAVIVAKGNIVDGNAKEGSIGGDTVSKLIRKTRNNEKVKAIVLRVDSGGGSAFASELIREELVKAQEQGIKVVVSMGDVAASGGYWVAATADEIWAKPSTITGSIGIFGLVPTFEKPLNKYGIFNDGVTTTKYANFYDPAMPLSDDVADIIQTYIDTGYDNFIDLVAQGRNMSKEEVDKIAQGRVWSGKQAHQLGLVDKLGSLNEAIKSAAELAEVKSYDTWFVKRELTEQELFVKELLNSAKITEYIRQSDGIIDKESLIEKTLLKDFKSLIQTFDELNDPKHAYAKCFCDIK